jgi:hypothetical protein
LLRKIYLIPPEDFKKCETIKTAETVPPHPSTNAIVRKQRIKTDSHDKWLKVKKQMREDKARNEPLIKSIEQFLRKVLPSSATTQAPVPEITAPTFAVVEDGPTASPSKKEYDDGGEEDVPEYSFCLRASPYLAP